eukprot:TRINITY_DN5824_c0_g1_i1.p1 TRINITY_DN5824_c0_g1~~TRINITY_DN5824_c0_g1_i1.p1  ORF type:complete len:137 (+),score=3.90 TRINITY_DN5824_c0_g1_i1:422-832(+)
MTPLCVLDFYVYEKLQRSGYGKKIFDKMLSTEHVNPAKLAYDRPSDKLYPFLKKYYKLSNYISQNNNFVIFRNYFTPAAVNFLPYNRINPCQRLQNPDQPTLKSQNRHTTARQGLKKKSSSMQQQSKQQRIECSKH